MWQTLRVPSEAGRQFAQSVDELLQSTMRHIIVITGGVYLTWQIVAALTWPETIGLYGWSTTLVVGVALALSLWLLRWGMLPSQVAWQAGLAAAITLAMYTYQEPLVGFFYALLPLMAAVTLGGPAGLTAEGLVICLTVGPLFASLSSPLSPPHAVAIAAAGAFSGLLGWVATRALLTVTEWSIYSFEQARRHMEDARDQRVELKQTREDLLHANRELARLSDRLSAMYQVAEEARRAKEAFVANVSHELRTPLNMIIGFSEMIPKLSPVYGTRLPPALLSDIAAIQRNSQHLSKLVDDVLDLSQVEAGRMALSKEPASLPEIVEEAVQAVSALYQSKHLSLEAEVPPDLPVLLCDGTRIRQVLINLLSNAGRFTDEGGVCVRVRQEKGEVIVSVQDTGPGIAPEHQQRIFEPFEPVDASIHRRHGGSGLGLSISKRFVEMHGGRMWLESEVGSGTTFHFSLPSEAPAPAHDTASARRWINPYFQYEPRVRRSLVPARELLPRYVILEAGDTLGRMFSRYMGDVEAVTVRDIDTATQELSRSPAQALVVNMPMFPDAPSWLPRLSALPYQTPAVTCWVPGDDEAAKRLGVVSYLVKPISREMLLSSLERLARKVETVLLVDDEPEALRLLARMLSSAGRRLRILQATNGPRALALLKERRPDVMVLDLVMPGMDGFQVLQEKTQDPAVSDIPVVVISSRDPSGEPVVSEALSVTRAGGLSVRDLLACIRAVSEVLAPSAHPGGRGQTGTPAG